MEVPYNMAPPDNMASVAKLPPREVPYNWSVWLPVAAMLLVSVVFVISMVFFGFEALLPLFYLAFLLFHAALYLRRRLIGRLRDLGVGLLISDKVAGLLRRHRLRRGLGYAAIVMGAFMTALFFCSFAPAATMPVSLRGVVWLGLAVADYFFYRLTVLHLEDEEEEFFVQGQAKQMRLLPI